MSLALVCLANELLLLRVEFLLCQLEQTLLVFGGQPSDECCEIKARIAYLSS